MNINSSGKVLTSILVIVLIASATGVVVGNNHLEVSAADRTVDEGQIATVPVTLNEAPNGLSGFTINATTNQGSSIENVNVVNDFREITGTVHPDGTAEVSGVDFSGNITDGADNVKLFELEIKGETSGTSTVSLEVETIEDAADPPQLLDPSTDSGEITISSESNSEPVINNTASSITPNSIPVDSTDQFQAAVKVEDLSSTNTGGEIDVQIEDFQFETDDDSSDDGTTGTQSHGGDITLRYDQSDISGNTLTVSKSVSATAPSTTGTRDVYVTDLRSETDGSDGVNRLIEDERIVIDKIEVTDENSDNTPPTATFNYQPSTPSTGTTVTFDASDSVDPDGSISSYDWDLDGDGSVDASGETVSNTYDTAGDYQATLTVTDNSDATTSSSKTISVSTSDTDIVVAPDGTGDYTSIQNAIDNATTGDRIKVKSGTYEQHTDVNKNITLYAPEGATIANTSAVSTKYNKYEAQSGFQIYGDVTPTISGFTLTDWRRAISAGASEGSWTVKNTDISGGRCGVCAAVTPGDWTVKNTTITNAGTVSAYKSTGDWEIVDTKFKKTDIFADKSTGNPIIKGISLRDAPSDGIKIEESTGVITISDSIIANSTYAAIEAENTSADIGISETSISNSDTGIDFEEDSTGDLTVKSTTINEIKYDAIENEKSSGSITIKDTSVETADNGIDAEKSTGQMVITNFTVRDTDGDGIDASNATGNATVQKSTFRNVGDKSIDVIDSEGKWEIHESILTGGREGGIDAWDAAFSVNASYNYWNESTGPSGDYDGSGAAAAGNISVNPHYTDSALTQLATVDEDDGGQNTAPIVKFNYQPNTPTTGTTVSFDASDSTDPDGSISSYEWGFDGDGTPDDSGKTATFTYDSAIEYQVNLTVTDNDGATNTTSQTITIEPADDGGYVDVDPSDLPGSGTNADPYVITNASELQAMEDDLGAHYELGADIDASNTSQWNDGSGFDPIGNSSLNSEGFSGSLDGNDKTVTGLVINRPDEDDVGLIGAADTPATISGISSKHTIVNGSKNVGGLVGENAASVQDATATGSVNGSKFVGLLIGDNSASVQDATATGSVNGSRVVGGLVGHHSQGSIRNATATGTVTGRNDVNGGSSNIGGLVGENSGTIQNAKTTVTLTGPDGVGGLVGNNNGPIQNATATGDVHATDGVGGLMGFNSGPIQNVTATGKVTGESSVGGLAGENSDVIQNATALGAVTGSDFVGGLVGINVGNEPYNGTIRDTFAVGSVSSSGVVGGLVARNVDGNIQDSYWDTESTGQTTSAGQAVGFTTAEMTGQAARTNMDGLPFGTIWVATQDDYPQLTGSITDTGDINTPPIAKFDYQPATPTAGTTISFDAANSSDPDGSISSYDWDFDNDGSIEASGKTVSYSFSSTGEYQVSLTVTDNESAIGTASQVITVGDRIELELDANRTTINPGEPIKFTLSSAASGNGVVGNISIAGTDTTTQTDADGTAVLKPTETGVLTVKAAKKDAEQQYAPDTLVIKNRLEPVTVSTDLPVTFGSLSLGATNSTPVTLRNPNLAPVDISAEITDGATTFGVATDDTSQMVPAEGSTTITTTYSPTDRGATNGALSIRVTEAADQLLTVPLNGTGVAPRLNVTESPDSLEAAPNQTDTTTFELRNVGNAELDAALSVADPFTVTSNTDLSLDPEATTTVDVEFKPTADTPRSPVETLTIATENPAVEDREVRLSGTVEQSSIDVVPETIDFGNIAAGSEADRQVTIINTGTTSIDDLSATTTTDAFELGTPAAESIELAATGFDSVQRLTVRSNLSATSQTEGKLLINGSRPAENRSVTLVATPTAPDLSVDVSDPIAVETTTGTRTTTEVPLTNDGTAPLVVETAEAFTASEQAAGFSIVGGQDTRRIQPGQTTEIPVRFATDTTGIQTANLSINTNDDQASPDAENITIRANVSSPPTDDDLDSIDAQNFGTVGIGTTSSDTFTVTYSGSQPVNITEASVSGPTNVFDITATAANLSSGENITLTDGEQTAFRTAVAPDAESTQTATVTITGHVGDDTITTSTVLVATGQPPELGSTQRRIRFGAVETGQRATESITFSNTGPAGTVLNVTATGDTGPFDTDGSINISGGEETQFDISFDPGSNDIGEFDTTLRLQIDGPLRTTNRTVRLSATGTGPEPSLSMEELDIGSMSVGQSINRTVTLENTGGVPFTVDRSQSNTQTDAPVTVSEVSGSNPLVPGEDRPVVLTISPTEDDIGSLAASGTVATQGDASDTLTVAGEVQTPDALVTPDDTISFGSTATGSATQQAVTINNTGNATLDVAKPTFERSAVSAFDVVSGAQQFRVAPDSEETVVVSFAPESVGTQTANLTIEPLNDPTATKTTIQLSGTGTTADAAIDPTSIEFGDVSQGVTETQDVTVRNDGNAPLNITSVATPAAFTLSELSTADTIPANSERTATVTVDTTGTARGALTGTLTIGTNDSTLTSTLGARTVAPAFASTSTTTEFETTRLGTTTLETVVIENDGNAPLALVSPSMSGADAAGFSLLDGPTDQTLAPSETARYTVQFDPSNLTTPVARAQGTQSDRIAEATLTVGSPNASVSSFDATLEGDVVTPAVEVDRRTIRFPETTVGETLTRNVTVSNNATAATAAVNVTDVSVSGADSQAYDATLTGSTPVTLTPGDSERVEVELTPESTGAKYATLSVQTNDTRQPVKKVGLSNTDTVYSVEYGSVNVTYFNPTNGAEPTVDVDTGFQDRNASLTAVGSTVNTSREQYRLAYTYSTTVQDSLAGSVDDAKAVQYIDATTTATPENFSNSTFEIAVSKAALAATNTTPENVTVYHKTDSGYEPLSTTRLFETSQGHVYEVTTDSYSIFAVSVLNEDDSNSEDESDDETDNTGGGSGGGGGGGAGGGGGGGSTDQGPPSIQDVESTLQLVSPTTTATMPLEDTDSSQNGLTVTPENPTTVDEINFNNGDLSGTVEVTEYTEPPQTISEDVATSVAADFESQSSSSGTALTDASDISVLAVTDIAPTVAATEDSSATVELTIDADQVTNPDQLQVIKETYSEEAQATRWNQLPIEEQSTTDNEITMTVEVDSFSLFAITEVDGATQTSGTSNTATSQGTNTGGNGGIGIVGIVGIVAVVLIAGVALYLKD
jgi:PGF-pre-PGF domain-containing protein